MLTKRFGVEGSFSYGDFCININVGIIGAEDKENAISFAYSMDFGEVSFDLVERCFIHNAKTYKILEAEDIICCEVFNPRMNYKHELLMGVPIYEDDDYQKITLDELITIVSEEATLFNKNILRFESISYAVSEIR